jgi:3-oxoacyl-[acyl-carrier protein] reductase
MYQDLKGRRALVTGASKGIGFAIAEGLAREGVKVLMVARNEQNLLAAVDKVKQGGGDVMGYAADVGTLNFLQDIQAQVAKFLGSADILVNNASGPPMANLLDTTPEIWTSAIQTHLYNVIHLSKAFLPGMRDRKYGRIITISSSLAIEPSPEMIVSATVRAGVSSFSKAIGTEFAMVNVTANVICPGGVLTERLENLVKASAERAGRDFNEVLRETEASIPAGRFAQPSELASLATYLCSLSAGYITGQSILIDGGVTKSF